MIADLLVVWIKQGPQDGSLWVTLDAAWRRAGFRGVCGSVMLAKQFVMLPERWISYTKVRKSRGSC